MLDILDIINEATKEANSFENHAAKGLTLEERLLYLQGLALVMNADGEIHPEEKEYIRILIKSFEMDESILESFVEFAQRPDKDTIQAFFRTFRRRPIAHLFLFDALMMTRRDDSVDEREKAVVDKIAEQLEVLKGTYQDIFDLFCHIKNKDWEESALYFSSHLLNADHFKHLLDYFEVDLDDLLERTSILRKDRILRILKGRLEPDFDVNNPSLDIDNEVIIPMLQAGINRGEIKVIIDVIEIPDFGEFSLSDLGVGYNQETKELFLIEKTTVNEIKIIEYFGKVLNLNGFDTYNFIWGGDSITIGDVDPDNTRVVNLSQPYQEGHFIIIDGTLWRYSEGGRYNIHNQCTLYTTPTSSFNDIGTRDNYSLYYSLTDSDSKGYLHKVKLI
ncbi:tellurite resistance TerB family protein [Vibrio parahaemolyticus]|uniref:tellurite resistance TerB family protein n=1 Tax=Vibrio parahaemolyticus TaxID=670 RepID=UPI0004186E62|nr:TerB family tellurite resistance protein [Vibrio parahaemolyticus]